jgi:hypothetical protein
MPTEKALNPKQADSLPVATIEWWKPQAAALQSLYGEALTLAEARLRKQADLLHELAGSKSFADALKTQTSFVQAFWADVTQDSLKTFASLRRQAGPEG